MSEVNINRADVQTLARLNGIGEKMAARIIDYRETVHPFAETIELAAVPGISERMVRALEGKITVGPLPAAANVQTDETGSGAPTGGEAMAEGEIGSAVPEHDADEEDLPQDEEIDIIIFPANEAAARAARVDEAAPFEGEVLTGEAGEPPAPAGAGEPEEAAVEPGDRLPPPPRRRGCASPFTALVAGLTGALFGAGLTLFALYLLNGTLNFATPVDVARLDGQVQAQGEGQSGMGDELAVLATRVAEVATAEATAAADLAQRAERLEQELATVETEVAGELKVLATETGALSTRIAALSASAENFDLFLDGMRDLLVDLRGLPALPATVTVTPTATITGTLPTGTAVAPESTEPGTTTPTPVVTRTPRPTATPLVSPTATAVNIP